MNMLVSPDCFGPVLRVDKPDFKLHPLCTAFPRADDVDVAEMCKITRLMGGILNEPATLWEGMILDGGNRQKVCRLCEVPFEYREFTGTYEQARAFVIAKNLGRRHMTGQQKAASMLKIVQEDKKRGLISGSVVRAVADAAGVSPSLAAKVNRLRDDGSLDRVISGETSVREELDRLAGNDDPFGRSAGEIDPALVPADVICDDDGREVPLDLHEVWCARPLMVDLRKDILGDTLERAKKVVNHPGGRGVSVEYLRMLRDLVGDLEGKRPSLVCPHCLGSGVARSDISDRRWRQVGKEDQIGKCYLCQARGWLAKDEPRPGPEWESQLKLAS
jgi:hypothetical protein